MPQVVSPVLITDFRVFVLDWLSHMLLFYASGLICTGLDRALTIHTVVAVPVGGDGCDVFAVSAVNDANGVGKSSEHWLSTN
jgi:hypothetical protein